jgi:nucleotide-binding universal stress UspA family protein
LSERLAAWQAAYQDVDVRIDVSHMRPADALVAASRHSDLLLLGRGERHGYGQLSSLTHALMRESLCPLEVVPG